jgi:SHS2 domain-containing protein
VTMGNDVNSAPSHAFEDHTAELRVRLDAPTLAGLFEEAGRALGEVMGAAAGEAKAEGEPEAVELEAPDREALLVEWMNELIYLAETRGKVYTEHHVERAGEGSLSAKIRGHAVPEGGLHVKAATFHGLSVVEGPRGFSATVILDV